MPGESFDAKKNICSTTLLDVDFMKPSTDCHQRETV